MYSLKYLFSLDREVLVKTLNDMDFLQLNLLGQQLMREPGVESVFQQDLATVWRKVILRTRDIATEKSDAERQEAEKLEQAAVEAAVANEPTEAAAVPVSNPS